ncbi:MAG: hypothetical protein IJ711_12640 [Lachnospiraceae bacterium]|nr:hypothetical protein [Lachnospiraceae bacterium]
MKIARRIATALLMLTVAVTALHADTIDAEAAAPKSHTYVLDKKSGAGYPTAVRVGVGVTHSDFEVYLKDKGDYVAKVTSSSSDLIAKVTRTYKIKKDNGSIGISDYFGDAQFKGTSEITCYAYKEGTYTLTLTINNAKKKQIAKKKIKVYAGATEELSKMTYAGKSVTEAYGGLLTSKAKGKLVVKAGKDFTIKKIQVGGYKADGTIDYKTVKNGSTITLSTVKAYQKKDYSYQSDYSSYESGVAYDYIYPATHIKVTVYDKKLKTTYDVTKFIFKQ